MATSTAFDFATEQLESLTDLSGLEARGTVRLALKAAGLDAGSVTAEQMGVVVSRVLPVELTARNVTDADSVCTKISQGLARLDTSSERATTDDVFKTLGG